MNCRSLSKALPEKRPQRIAVGQRAKVEKTRLSPPKAASSENSRHARSRMHCGAPTPGPLTQMRYLPSLGNRRFLRPRVDLSERARGKKRAQSAADPRKQLKLRTPAFTSIERKLKRDEDCAAERKGSFTASRGVLFDRLSVGMAGLGCTFLLGRRLCSKMHVSFVVNAK